ncbi:MAG TPA: alcohol dehydrogenase [Verrucomicrobiales bacterium]|nr:alcohol dehydrogenase [Verrucomicrobiales bacterium]HRJ07967.1 PQQ-like beta-propeller repeat protein [Prosthecobacter sp.]HRK14101.1 PQQ-like beta-propeller repeat protein [Prosthecobacter sp.]
MNCPLHCLLGGSLLAAAGLSAQTSAPVEWGKFRGPNNDGSVPAPQVSNWKGARVKTLWKAETPKGFSSFAVAGGKAFTLVTGEYDGNSGEMIVCLDVRTGKELWSKPLSIIGKYDGGGDAGTNDNKGGDGPRSTPVVDGDKVYVIDSSLGVHCFSAAGGDLVWNRDVLKENAGVQIRWQNAASPVIEGNVLMMCGGGEGQALLGLDKTSGKVLWKGEDDKMTHATPVVADLLGTRQCIFFTQTGLVSVLPESGKVLWRQPYRFNISTAASPVVFEDIVYCSAGYGVGAGAYQISKSGSSWKSKEIWRKENDDFANHWSTPVVKDGHLYGMFSFKKYGEGPLACVDIRTGDMKWSTPGFGPGQVILAGDSIIALSDKGELVVVEANPRKYTELKREEVLEGKVWSYPVLAYNRLFARSTTEGVCLEFQ